MVRSGSPQRKGDVSIADDPDLLVFAVTMRNLQEKDTGWYRCGVEINGAVADSTSLLLTVTTGKMGLLHFPLSVTPTCWMLRRRYFTEKKTFLAAGGLVVPTVVLQSED
ncbi:hypothetical protein Z043_126247 [Scleropages formosus]|uniref:Immunoglobulin V-set domain-containing protein n=1 Tax=Scleropages formosus TaxID=113540 RepID=A0A0P7TFE5_SCLFO|nr:hypothetical protein Z043_126247 [Scleropages formosus]